MEMNKDTLCPILFIKLPTLSLSTLNAAKSDGLQKKNLLKDCNSVIQSIKEAQRKVPIEFQFGEKCNLPGSFQYYPEEKHFYFQIQKAVTSLHECKHINAEEADQSKGQFVSFVDSEAKKSAEEFCKFDMVNDGFDKFFGRCFF